MWLHRAHYHGKVILSWATSLHMSHQHPVYIEVVPAAE